MAESKNSLRSIPVRDGQIHTDHMINESMGGKL